MINYQNTYQLYNAAVKVARRMTGEELKRFTGKMLLLIIYVSEALLKQFESAMGRMSRPTGNF